MNISYKRMLKEYITQTKRQPDCKAHYVENKFCPPCIYLLIGFNCSQSISDFRKPSNMNGFLRIVSVAQHLVGVKKIYCAYISLMRPNLVVPAGATNTSRRWSPWKDRICARACRGKLKSAVKKWKDWLLCLATYKTMKVMCSKRPSNIFPSNHCRTSLVEFIASWINCSKPSQDILCTSRVTRGFVTCSKRFLPPFTSVSAMKSTRGKDYKGAKS